MFLKKSSQILMSFFSQLLVRKKKSTLGGDFEFLHPDTIFSKFFKLTIYLSGKTFIIYLKIYKDSVSYIS